MLIQPLRIIISGDMYYCNMNLTEYCKSVIGIADILQITLS